MSEASKIPPIAELIRARRRQLGWSQTDLATEVSSVDQATVTGNEIARYERGKRTPRKRARETLSVALGVPLRQLDIAAAIQRSMRSGHPLRAEPDARMSAISAIRAALLDNGGSTFWIVNETAEGGLPDIDRLRRDLADMMTVYQASRYHDMLEMLPEVLLDAHVAVRRCDDRRDEAQRILALANQAAATVLTKLGELDLAWTAADRGLAAAQRSGDEAVLGSLCRSVVHTLQSHGRADAATRLTEKAADNLRQQFTPSSERAASVYGTLLLAGAMAAARAGDRQTTREYLDEADTYARHIGYDANHLWTAFGPTNVAIHRLATSVALHDVPNAYRRAHGVDTTRLPLERRVRHTFDVVRVAVERRDVDNAIAGMLTAERLAPEQVYNHVISQQLVADLRRTSEGKRSAALTQLARGMYGADAAS